MLNSESAAWWLDYSVDTDRLTVLFDSVLSAPLAVTPIDPAINNARSKVVPKPIGDGKTTH